MADKQENRKNAAIQSQTELAPPEIPQLHLKSIQGVNGTKLQNFLVIDNNTYLYVSGLRFSIVKADTKEEVNYFSKDGGGIGCAQIHPSKRYIAIGEKGEYPNIYIYEYPSMEVCKVLKKGAERSFMALGFSHSGSKLASVGYEPDYSLIIWDWKNESIILRAKAFSQEVYSIGFSRYREDLLCTSGMAHIKFWKIAKTFTGLKLKGSLGKFGQVELSDINSFAILADEKVVSGSENGNLLLWEGNFIKAVIKQSRTKSCHESQINVVQIITDKYLLTAGTDQCVKIWDLSQIDNLEGDDSLCSYLEPVRELFITKDCNIVNAQIDFLDQGQLILQNSFGNVITVKFNGGDYIKGDYTVKETLDFVPGRIIDIQESGSYPVVAYDSGYLVNLTEDEGDERIRIEEQALTALKLSRGFILTGNSKGVLQVFNSSYSRLDLCRVFTEPVTQILTDEGFVICVSETHVFVLSINDNGKLKPEFLYSSKTGSVTKALAYGLKAFVGCSDGRVVSFELKRLSEEITRRNYEVEGSFIKAASGRLRMMEFQKPKVDEDDINFMLSDNVETIDVEWDPARINTIAKLTSITVDEIVIDDADRFVWVSSEGEFTGYIYLIELGNSVDETAITRPKAAVQVRAKQLTYFSLSDDCYMLGYEDGIVEVRSESNLEEVKWRTQSHDADIGRVLSFGFSKKYESFLSIARDNTLVFYTTEEQMASHVRIQKATKKNKAIQIDKALLDGYSLQEEKIKAVEDRKEKEANDFKEDLRNKLQDIRHRYNALKRENDTLPPHFRVPADKLIFDENFRQYVKTQVSSTIEEALKDVEYAKNLSDLKVQKLHKYFLDSLSDMNFAVTKVSNNDPVASFKLQKLTKYIQTALEKINRTIENETETDEEMVVSSDNIEAERAVKTKELIATLKKLKAKQQENKNVDFYQFLKSAIKEECRPFEGVDELREYKKKISKELKMLKRKGPTITSSNYNKEIEDARKNFGNFILKDSEEYRVSEENSINVTSLETHILLVEKFIYNSAKMFNNTLKELRDEKNAIMGEVDKANAELQIICGKMGCKFEPFTYVFDRCLEYPESRWEVTEQELEEYCVHKNSANDPNHRIMLAMRSRLSKETSLTSATDALMLKDDQLAQITNPGRKVFRPTKVSKSQRIEQIRLNSQKDQIRETIKKRIDDFDAKVQWAIDERIKLDTEIKMAEMRTYELYRELLEAEVYEEQDQAHMRELFNHRETLKIWNTKKLPNTIKLKEIDSKEQELFDELEETREEFEEKVFPSNKEKGEFVFNYFRLMQKANGQQGGTLKTEESEDGRYTLEGEKKEWVLMTEQNEEWSDLIKKRLKLETELMSIREEKNILEVECNKIEENIIMLQSDIDEVKQKIDELQLIKLKKINKLVNSYILTLDQIYLSIPLTSLDHIILFTEQQLESLRTRIAELKADCKEIEVEKAQLIISREALNKELALLRNCRKKALENLKENFQLKFGEVIDLKILDAMKQTKRLKELKEELKETEKKSSKRIEEATATVENTKKELYELKRKNTEIIKKITALGNTQLKLNKTLDTTNKHIFKSTEGDNTENIMKYRKDLMSIIQLLNTELDELKNEIITLKNKG